jgi:metallo-beta-lactamase family protein
VKGPAVIISASGMMTGGRILHHLKNRLPDPKNTILLGGFMAEGTRGRLLADGAQFLKIHGGHIPVRAAKANVSGLSGHADRSELLRWLEKLPSPTRVFLTHGEKAAALVFAEELAARRGWNVHVPRLGESVELA